MGYEELLHLILVEIAKMSLKCHWKMHHAVIDIYRILFVVNFFYKLPVYVLGLGFFSRHFAIGDSLYHFQFKSLFFTVHTSFQKVVSFAMPSEVSPLRKCLPINEVNVRPLLSEMSACMSQNFPQSSGTGIYSDLCSFIAPSW